MSREAILIAAVTARALAQSAVRAGFAPIVLDLFNDQDLPAKASRRVCAKNALRFDQRQLLLAAKELASDLPLVYGAGFEGCPRALHRLAQGRKLYGNSPETLARIHDAKSFFALLDDLNIPHPEVSFAFPRSPDGWLAKKMGAAGGWHVRLACNVRPGRGHYFQQRVSGRSLSVLFLANGSRMRIIGFNETWTKGGTDAPYCYAGAINHAPVPVSVRTAVAPMLDGLVDAVKLVGLNGLDFMLQDEQVNVLEINARPPATLDLYDADFVSGLLASHLQACRGTLPLESVGSNIVRASAVVYADVPVVISPKLSWPAYAADIPRAGTFVGRGAPICTVRSEGRDFARVKSEVLRRRNGINDRLLEKAA